MGKQQASGEKALNRPAKRQTDYVDLPHRFIYGAALKLLAPYARRRCNVHITRRGMENIKPPYVVFSNHASRLDWIYVGMAFWPDTLNIVVTRYFYSDPKLRILLKQAGAIAKDQFSPDIAAVKNIYSVIKRGGCIMLFPEGRTTPGGQSETFERSAIKLLKHLGVAAVGMRIDGGYLTMPKWNTTIRKGRVDVTVEPIFTPEEISGLAEEELYERLCGKLFTDDLAWQRENRVPFKGKDIAVGLDGVLHQCPRCETELAMTSDTDSIRCKYCGNGASLNEYYDLLPFDDCCVIPNDISAWYNWQREQINRQIEADPLLEYISHATLLQVVHKRSWLKPVGEGTLRLNSTGLYYSGTRFGEPFELHIPLAAMPAMAYSPNKSIEIYYNGELYSFCPEQPQSAQKWSMLTEQLYRHCVKRDKSAR